MQGAVQEQREIIRPIERKNAVRMVRCKAESEDAEGAYLGK